MRITLLWLKLDYLQDNQKMKLANKLLSSWWQLLIILFLLSCGDKTAEMEEDIDPDPIEEEEPEPNLYFVNPVWSRGADPWVVLENGKYYFTYTAGSSLSLYEVKRISDYFEGDNFVLHSRWRPPSGTAYSSNLWAPELHKINNKWYAYIAADNGENRNHRMYVLEYSGSQLSRGGDWMLKGKMTDPTDNWAIDGTILEHEGQLYTIWSGWSSPENTATQNLYIARMSNPWTIDGERVLISRPDYAWEKHGNPINEGPAIITNKDGEVFLTYSGSGFWTDDYCLGLLKLKPGGNPMVKADWIKYDQPILTRNDEGGVFGPGHNGFFKSPDGTEDWVIYHARNLPGGGDTNYRNVRIQKVNWNEAASPTFERAVSIGEKIKRPSGE